MRHLRYYYINILVEFSRNPANACTFDWAAYPKEYNVGSVAYAVVNGESGFHAQVMMQIVL